MDKEDAKVRTAGGPRDESTGTVNQLEFGMKALEKLKKIRTDAKAYKAQFDKTDDFDAPLFPVQ